MAVAKQLGDLLRLAVSGEEEALLYFCATCLVLEQQSRERGGETASEELLAGLLGQLNLELEERAKCRRGPTWDGRELERSGEGVGEGPEVWEGEWWESVWQLCREAARVVGAERRQTLESLVCECHHFQVVCCQLLATALAAARSCGFWLRERRLETRFLQRFLDDFWSVQVNRFATRVDPISDGAQLDVHILWCCCLEHLVVLITIHGVSQEMVAPFTHAEEFLCRNASNKLTVKLSHSFPQALRAVYQQWWNIDKEKLQNSSEIPTINKKGTGLVLKSAHTLDSSLSLFASILVPWNGLGTVEDICLQTVLRLANLHLTNLSQIVQLVPKRVPLKLWYIVINSALCLHSMLTRLQSILSPSGNYGALFFSLLEEVTQFADTLTSHAISHHSSLLRYSILQDPDAGHWNQPQPYHEGEGCSLPLQMWHYHLCGLRDDLWEVGDGGGGGVGVRILRGVLCDSVAVLSQRYTQVTPSFERTGQLRADILFVLLAVESVLPYISISPSSSSSFPSSFPTLTSSCHSLLHTLSILTSPLSLLLSSLETTPISPTPHKPHLQWLHYIDSSSSGILATSNQIADDTVRIFKNFVSLPYPSWHLLTKFLLSKRGQERIPSLLITMATTHKQTQRGEGPNETGDSENDFVNHILQVLSHCVSEPQLLSGAISLLDKRKRGTDDTAASGFQMLCCVEWLGQAVKEHLQRCLAGSVVRVAGGLRDGGEKTQDSKTTPLCGDDFNSGLADSTRVSGISDHILKLLDTLDCALAHLPSPVKFALSHMARTCSSTGVESGARVAEVLGSLISPWLSSSPLPFSLPPHLHSLISLPLSLISWTLGGADTNNTPFPPALCEAIKEGAPLIIKRLEAFGSSLLASCPNPVPDDLELGHEVMADMLENSPQAQESLHYIHQWLKARKDCVIEMLQLPSNDQTEFIVPPSPPNASLTPQRAGFNPFKVGVSIWSKSIDQKQLMELSLHWKDLLALTVSQVPQQELVKLVRNRFEFQPNAQLLDNEPELVQKINNLIGQKSPQLN